MKDYFFINGTQRDNATRKIIYIALTLLIFFSARVYAGPNYVSGQITSLRASATEPAIRLTGNVTPDDCDGGTYGWLHFEGTPEERNRVYASALALSLAGKSVSVYTNSDGTTCRINNIQVTSGLN